MEPYYALLILPVFGFSLFFVLGRRPHPGRVVIWAACLGVLPFVATMIYDLIAEGQPCRFPAGQAGECASFGLIFSVFITLPAFVGGALVGALRGWAGRKASGQSGPEPILRVDSGRKAEAETKPGRTAQVMIGLAVVMGLANFLPYRWHRMIFVFIFCGYVVAGFIVERTRLALKLAPFGGVLLLIEGVLLGYGVPWILTTMFIAGICTFGTFLGMAFGKRSRARRAAPLA